MSIESLEEYFAALDRLIKHEPINVTKGSKISKDNVAKEAGRKRGAIRESFTWQKPLLDAIEEAKKEKNTSLRKATEKISIFKEDIASINHDLVKSLNREIMLLDEKRKYQEDNRKLSKEVELLKQENNYLKEKIKNPYDRVNNIT